MRVKKSDLFIITGVLIDMLGVLAQATWDHGKLESSGEMNKLLFDRINDINNLIDRIERYDARGGN